MTTQDATYLISEILMAAQVPEDRRERLHRACDAIRRTISDQFPPADQEPTGYHVGVFRDSTINLSVETPQGSQEFVVTIRHKV